MCKANMQENPLHKIRYFSAEECQQFTLPEKFTFPFFYEPLPITRYAVADLQNYLMHQTDFEHNFGLNKKQAGMVIGKMFGVLIIQDSEGKIGYLAAFSGKLAGSNHHSRFVPPVFDMLDENGFFIQEEKILNTINATIETLEKDEVLLHLKAQLIEQQTRAQSEIKVQKEVLKNNKKARQEIRASQIQLLSPEAFDLLEKDLVKQSLHDKHQFNVLQAQWKITLQSLEEQIREKEEKIVSLKKERKEKSAALQQQLFDQYYFYNQKKETKSLAAIFGPTPFGKPPAAAGECATPKLLHFAFQHDLKPIAMAEFWWGASPKSEIRKHQHFYPACTGKCKPILQHMLEGISLDENPMLLHAGKEKEITVLYEDESIVVVYKPAELLSVPGIDVQDAVLTRLQIRLHPIEPIVVHRLDMATSGILVFAKTKEAHKHLQKQFLKRTVEKRYTALLDGILTVKEGEINLPLRGDIDDRPRQMVCYEFGKKARTLYKVVAEEGEKTKVHFWPLTGRTHQLRVHAAHSEGLNAPIMGDDLYGTSADRLYLHAAELSFVHPLTLQRMHFEIEEEF